MDPNATLQAIETAILNHEPATAEEYLEYLQEWLAKGGFEPIWTDCPLAAKYYKGTGSFVNVITYFELSSEWQAEADSNADNAEEGYYLEPEDDAIPEKHILWDLLEAHHADDGTVIIPISNNSAGQLIGDISGGDEVFFHII